MTMDPQIAGLLQVLTSQGPIDWSQMSAATFRAASQMPPAEHPQPVGAISEQRIAGIGGDIPLRIYQPSQTGTWPLLVFFHGGGFVIGDLNSHDNLCRALCEALPAVVVSVDYRLAPEHRFPSAVEDAYTATVWAGRHAAELGADAARIVVGGDSAGGNLAAVVAQLAKDSGDVAIAHQMLLYPVCDTDLNRQAYQRLGQGNFLETPMMQWFWDHYLVRPEDALDPRAAPLKAKDLAGLPSATVVTAGFDPLNEEAECYVKRLAEAGVNVSHHPYPGAIHGFMSFLGMVSLADQALAEVVGQVKQSLRG